MHQESLNQPQRIRISARITLVQRGRRGLWSADFHQAGKHRRRSLGTASRRVAEERARALELDLLQGGPAPSPRRALPIREAIVAFLEAKRVGGQARKTLVKYASELGRLADFAERHGVTLVEGLTLPVYDRYQAQRMAADGLQPYTVYTHGIIAKTWLKWCGKRHLLAHNPLAELEVTKPRRPRYPAPTPEQVQVILSIAGPGLREICAVAAFAGLRVGEIAVLRVNDVDLAGGFIHIRGHGEWKAKTAAAERRVPLHHRLRALLQDFHASHPGGPRRAAFFSGHRGPPSGAGTRAVNPRTVNVDFQRLATKAGCVVGLAQGGLTFHALRRFFKSACLDSGVPAPLVDLWLGHSHAQGINQHYYRPQLEVHWIGKVVFDPALTPAAIAANGETP